MRPMIPAAMLATLALILLPALAPAQWTEVDTDISGALQAIDWTADGQLRGATSNGLVYFSDDGGLTWAEQANLAPNDFNGLGFGPDGFGTLNSRFGTIYSTDDGGATWSTVQEGMMVSYYDTHTIEGTESSYVVGKNTILAPFITYTTNGWASSQSLTFYIEIGGSGNEGTLRGVDDVGGNQLIIACQVFDGSGAIVMSDEDLQTWTTVATMNNLLMDIAMGPNDVNGAAVSWLGEIFHTSDGGQSWTLAQAETGTQLNAVAFRTADHAVAVGMAGTMYESQDGGASWELTDSGVFADLHYVGFRGDAGVIGGGNGTVLLYGGGEPDPVTLTLTPTGFTDIPVQGGTITYDVSLVSTLNQSYPNVSFWTMVTLPNGNELGPLMTFPFTMQPMMDVTVTGMTLDVPGIAPAGEYTYHGFAGYMNGPNVTDSFTFNKTPFATDGDGVEQWKASGDLRANARLAD